MGRQSPGYKPKSDFWAMCRVTKFPKSEWDPFVEQVKAEAKEERKKCIDNGFKFDELCADYDQQMTQGANDE